MNDIKEMLVIENQYFSCTNYYLTLFRSADIRIESCESYRKMSFRNRCVLAGSNGLVQLSVPLQNGRDQKRLFKDVKIDHYSAWQRQHWHTIFSCYGKSPFFEFYRDEVEKFFLKNYVYLFDLNIELLNWLTKTLKLPGTISLTDSFIKSYPPAINDARDRWLPNNFQQGGYLVKYSQVFEDRIGFQPNLSILDLLFCEGPETTFILNQQLEG